MKPAILLPKKIIFPSTQTGDLRDRSMSDLDIDTLSLSRSEGQQETGDGFLQVRLRYSPAVPLRGPAFLDKNLAAYHNCPT
jgi:hypothetical protein